MFGRPQPMTAEKVRRLAARRGRAGIIDRSFAVIRYKYRAV
jgi:hypothetical protein